MKDAVSAGAPSIILGVDGDMDVGRSARSTSIRTGTDSTSSPDAAAPVAVKT